MDTQDHTEEHSEELPGTDELTMLKSRAKMMGIAFSNNIGLAALRAKVVAKQNDEEDTSDTTEDETTSEGEAVIVINALTGENPAAPKRSLRQFLIDEEMKLIRVRITNMDPKKADLPGEILTFANEILGTVKKYIPFGEVTENGYHVPHCLYQILKSRTFLHIRTVKGANGQSRVETKEAKEFALEVLPPLTPKEMGELATAQAAAGTFSAANN